VLGSENIIYACKAISSAYFPFHPRRAAQGGRGAFGEDCLSPRRGRVPQPPRPTEQRREARRAGGEGSPSFGSFSWGSKKRNTRGGAEPSRQSTNHARRIPKPHRPTSQYPRHSRPTPCRRRPSLLPLHQPHFPTAKQAANPSANPSAITFCRERSRNNNSSSRCFNTPASNSADGIAPWEMTNSVS